MILSVSRRTDIPAFFSEWFFNRIKEGFILVRNPMNIHQISRINLTPELIDCIVFWTKNPEKMIDNLELLKNYKYYFQFTVNPYNTDIEINIPKKKNIFNIFKKLSDKIGSKKVIWRYDPILYTSELNLEYHLKYFEIIAKELSGYTEKCVISFIDNYKKCERNLKGTNARELKNDEIFILAEKFNKIAKSYNLIIETCAEIIDLQEYDIKAGKCIDDILIEEIIGQKISSKKDKNQRKECGCLESIDVGEYNTCNHNCLYCYANFNREKVLRNISKHNSNSPILIGEVEENDIVNIRQIKSFINRSLLF